MWHKLCSAAAVDALAAVEQQRGQVDEVGERQQAGKASGGTVQKQEDYVGNIVEVAYDAVVAASEQQVAVSCAGGVTI
jgi:class 3 adenylate cyclase